MKHTLLFFSILICYSGYSQVHFFDGTLTEALKKATSSGKMVFVHFVSNSCGQCNDVADKAFESKALATEFEKKCIAVKIETSAPDRQNFIDKYNPEETIGSFYLRSDGDLVYRTTSTTSLDKKYIEDLNTAWNRLTEGRAALKELDDMWNNQPGFAAMEANLIRRNELILPLDSLLDVYAQLLPPDSLKSPRVIQFISRMAPAINSIAYKVSRKDSGFNKAWYVLPLKERIDINNRIISKSLSKAIEGKDRILATQTASFVWNVNNDTKVDVRRKKYEYTWINYLKGVGDSINYLSRAIPYYNRYYMSIAPDSIRRIDSLITAQRLATAKTDTLYEAGNKKMMRRSVQTSNTIQQYANYIAFAARNIYLHDKNKQHTALVLEYAKRSVEFSETEYSLDTYARLLYLMNEKTEAIAITEKLITLRKKHQMKADRYEALLAKMKVGDEIML